MVRLSLSGTVALYTEVAGPVSMYFPQKLCKYVFCLLFLFLFSIIKFKYTQEIITYQAHNHVSRSSDENQFFLNLNSINT